MENQRIGRAAAIAVRAGARCARRQPTPRHRDDGPRAFRLSKKAHARSPPPIPAFTVRPVFGRGTSCLRLGHGIGIGHGLGGGPAGRRAAGMGESAFSIANYRPPGPVARAFIQSTKIAPFIMGPVGSGKTTAAIFSNLRYTALMPVCSDGVIRAKGVVVRSDYRTLWRTTLPSWWQWFPRDFPGSTFTGGPDRPSTHELPFTTPRGRKIELTVEFAALGSHRIEDALRGWEGSGAHMEEADLMEER